MRLSVDSAWFLRGFVTFASVLAVVSATAVARGEDGGNDVCPAISVQADDVRERYDAHGRLVHQLRLRQSRVVEEVAIVHANGHAVARTEVTPGHMRIARTTWDGDRVAGAECFVDGRRTGAATYRYEGDLLVAVEKRQLVAAGPASGGDGAGPAEVWRVEATRFVHDDRGRLVLMEMRNADGKIVQRTYADRAPPVVPVTLSLTAGGTYQSDTELYDITAGLGIHRRPRAHLFGTDSLEVGLDVLFKFHRTADVTTTDQTLVRFAADYHQILPRITLFTFTSTDRNLPANLRLNLEAAVLGIKFDIVPRSEYQLDVSFAPVWNFRSIVAPDDADGDRQIEQVLERHGDEEKDQEGHPFEERHDTKVLEHVYRH